MAFLTALRDFVVEFDDMMDHARTGRAHPRRRIQTQERSRTAASGGADRYGQ